MTVFTDPYHIVIKEPAISNMIFNYQVAQDEISAMKNRLGLD
jgi:hypothetical protein